MFFKLLLLTWYSATMVHVLCSNPNNTATYIDVNGTVCDKTTLVTIYEITILNEIYSAEEIVYTHKLYIILFFHYFKTQIKKWRN